MSSPTPFDIRQPWSAPLVPVAFAFSAGVVVDRFAPITLVVSIPFSLLALLAWTTAIRSSASVAAALLGTALFGLGAAYHHVRIHTRADDDVSGLATPIGAPVYVEGSLTAAPMFVAPHEDEADRGYAPHGVTRGVLRVRRVTGADGLDRVASGWVVFTLPGKLTEAVFAGDRVRVLGRLYTPESPGNPGEFDYPAFLRDQGIGGVLRAGEHADAVTLLERSWYGSLGGWMSALREWGLRTLEREMPEQSALGQALLLGEGSGLGWRGWDKYVRTGVIHVLAISGQHLVVLAGFLWFVLRRPWWSRRTTASVIAGLLLGYALLTGGRPPVLRAAWMVLVVAAGIILRRQVLPANTFACAWLGVAVVNPANIFDTGCQLSFLAVAVLTWGLRPREPDELERLEAEQRSWPMTLLLTACRWLGWMYLINALVWLAVAPLLLSRGHILSPIALLISPPLVALTSLALITGFLLLLTAPLGLGISMPFAWITEKLLAGCAAIVDWGVAQPGAYFFLADVPAWWLVAFYAGLFLWLLAPRLGRWNWPAAALGATWFALGIVMGLGWLRTRDDRCTFVAVGHGGCVVLETKEGRVALYDIGSKQGAMVTQRQVAPFLWSRGIRRIDEVILSHADADHISGLPDLLDRFAVGRIVHTLSLAERRTLPVQRMLRAIERESTPVAIVRRDDEWSLGPLEFRALHPPEPMIADKENERSLVLHVRLPGMSLLLTGDLEGKGLPMVLSQKTPPIDVMQAPHHGSFDSKPQRLALWAKPRYVVSSQALLPGKTANAAPYAALGIPFLTTAESGAVTVTLDSSHAVQLESFRKKP